MKLAESNNNTQLQSVGLNTPPFYHRQYENDIAKPEEPKTLLDQCKRVGLVALPFISLCKPLGKPISLIADGLRSLSSLSSLVQGVQAGDSGQIASGVIHTAVSVASIAGTIFAHPLGMLITTGHDILLNASHLVQALTEKDYKKAAEMGAQMIASSLYLAMFFSGSLPLSILASSAQILLGVYRSADDFKKGNYLEAGGHLLMSAIRTNQLRPQMRRFLFSSQSQHVAATLCHPLPKENQEPKLSDDALMEKAVKEGNKEVMEILDKYKDNPYSEPALYHAIRKDDYQAAQVLIRNHARTEYAGLPTASKATYLQEIPPVEYKNSRLPPILWHALHKPYIPCEFVKLLIDNGAHVNYNHQEFATPSLPERPALVLAIDHERLDILQLLIDSRADVNATFSPYTDKSPPTKVLTPLSWICRMHSAFYTEKQYQPVYLEMAKLLLQNGADPNKTNPLYYSVSNAVAKKHFKKPNEYKILFDLTKLLLENKADMHQAVEIVTPYDDLEDEPLTYTPYKISGNDKEMRDLFDTFK